MKTQHNQTYRQQSVALDETEQQIILEVIRRAEALESIEQERVGLAKEIFHSNIHIHYTYAFSCVAVYYIVDCESTFINTNHFLRVGCDLSSS